MKSTLLCFLLIMAGCQLKKGTTSGETPDATVGLTEAQKKEGWVPLFDGQSMKGWRIFKNNENASWEVKDGALHCIAFDNRKIKEHTDLLTVEQYGNFELVLEWKIAPHANSGIMFRVTEDNKEPFLSGPEYQIVDDLGYGELKETNTTGGVYDMYVPQNKKLNPAGEWNMLKLVVNGNHVEHWLNGSQVVTYELGSSDWKKRKGGSKWNDAAGYGASKTGFIDLQDHGDEVWFRNILIRVL